MSSKEWVAPLLTVTFTNFTNIFQVHGSILIFFFGFFLLLQWSNRKQQLTEAVTSLFRPIKQLSVSS